MRRFLDSRMILHWEIGCYTLRSQTAAAGMQGLVLEYTSCRNTGSAGHCGPCVCNDLSGAVLCKPGAATDPAAQP